jgi:hypothetical protein
MHHEPRDGETRLAHHDIELNERNRIVNRRRRGVNFTAATPSKLG